MLVSEGNKLSSVCGELASKAGDTPGLFSPVPIAGDFGGVSSSSDLVTTAFVAAINRTLTPCCVVRPDVPL